MPSRQPTRIVTVLVSMCVAWTALHAQTYKPLPPPGIEIDAAVRESLNQRVTRLQQQLDAAAEASPDADRWAADVGVLIRAVRLALEQNLFFKDSEPAAADELLDEAARRLAAAAAGERGLQLLGSADGPSDGPQLLVGGFVSRIDDSVQPFGLVVPVGYRPNQERRYRLDVWLHGRGDTKTEVPFLKERMTKIGQYAPADTFVLHPFGRHCNAFKFAGEADVYEALDHASGLFAVNEDRVAIRGFSMGGAGCWHLAVHDPGRWFAVNPGAGFVDTIEYQGWQTETPYEINELRRKLLNWYDVLPWAENLKNTQTIAYSGEIDKQKRAADRVYSQSRKIGHEWTYVIGARMGHRIDPESQELIDEMIASWAADPIASPRSRIDFVTYTLRYSTVEWLSVTGLEKHWSPGRVQAQITGPDRLEIETAGITHLELSFEKSGWPHAAAPVGIRIDGVEYEVADSGQEPGLQCRLARKDGEWYAAADHRGVLRKRPGLQGPIDDAFCSRFLFVLPSRPARHGVVQRWLDREIPYAQDRWRTLMRGDVQAVLDTDLTDNQIATCNLICFGDFVSNRYLSSVVSALPVTWTHDLLRVGDRQFNPSTHAAVFCIPNPKNRERYLVVNSGMTFREFSNVSNSRQVAMLPDWAVMDVSQRSDEIFPAPVVAEGFFDENWELMK